MSTMIALDPAQREVLVNVGNRYVVFGPASAAPGTLHFRPDEHSEILPMAADESEIAVSRIERTLRVFGMKRPATRGEAADTSLELYDDEGNRVEVAVKVNERELKDRDIEQGQLRLAEAASKDRNLEIWYFNIERLKLTIMSGIRSRFQIDELSPLDVWENTSNGVFDRARVKGEVDDWVLRVEALYRDVQNWLGGRPGLRCEQSRTVTMSEELMRQFAVTDRDIPILDILRADQAIVSFVPRGLWTIGAWGRIDVITPDGTLVLVAVGGAENLEWRLVSGDDRRTTMPFTRDALLPLAGQT